MHQYAKKAMVATAAKSALRGSLDAAKRAIPHIVANKLITTVKRKMGDIINKSNLEPHSKKVIVGTTPRGINAIIDGSGIVLDYI